MRVVRTNDICAVDIVIVFSHAGISPRPGETRANFHAGGVSQPAKLDSADRRIVERLAPRLREEGLFFVGIDVIGGYLTEINVTSPTGVLEIDALESRCLEAELLAAVESRLRAHMETA